MALANTLVMGGILGVPTYRKELSVQSRMLVSEPVTHRARAGKRIGSSSV